MRRFLAVRALAVLLPFAAACGGGGGGSGSEPVLDLGLVSGSRPTKRAVTLVNPLDGPARVRAAGPPASFTIDPTSLPVDLVPAGGTFVADVIVVPAGPGELLGTLPLEFQGDSSSVVVPYAVRATVEDVRVTATPNVVSFGTPAFGSSEDRTILLVNSSTISIVDLVAGSFPTADFSVVDPPLPFTLAPSQSRVVRLRCAPFRSMQPVDGAAALRSSGADGSVDFTVRATPAAGTAVLDVGLQSFVGGLTEVFDVDVPDHVWALQVEAWRPDHLFPDFASASPGPGLPDAARELISLALFQAPDGDGHQAGWNAANGAFAACLPRSDLATDQLEEGGGTWSFQFALSDPPAAPVPVHVRVLMKATVDGLDPLAGTLNLNLWIGSATGLTAATAPSDAQLQNALAWFDALLQQVGVRLGNVAYHEFDESPSGPTAEHARYAAIRAALPKVAGQVPDRLSVFVGNHAAGLGGRIPGCAVSWSNHSFAMAGYTGNLSYLIAHESLHHLGLWHLTDYPLDVFPGGTPPNIMDASLGQSGNTVSPGQGRVIRAHPFVR